MRPFKAPVRAGPMISYTPGMDLEAEVDRKWMPWHPERYEALT
jgi:hypothetical protein